MYNFSYIVWIENKNNIFMTEIRHLKNNEHKRFKKYKHRMTVQAKLQIQLSCIHILKVNIKTRQKPLVVMETRKAHLKS